MKLAGEFHLLPSIWQGSEKSTLRGVYERAFSRAKELFIVSAFLTEWRDDLKLNPRCSAFRLIVGADFGTTRVAALRTALKWLPQRFAGNVLAFNSKGVSFHPKAMLWRERSLGGFMLIGSSNLTNAAFESNVEANVVLKLTDEEYDSALRWLVEISDASVVVNEKWFKEYVEAPTRGGAAGKGANRTSEAVDVPVFDLSLDLRGVKQEAEFKRLLIERRAQKLTFETESRKPLIAALKRAAAKAGWTERDNIAFYDELLRLWGKSHRTRMGGDQWQIRGKHSDHQELARSLLAVLNAPVAERDDIVVRERNRLHEAGIATRAALFSELLCHLFPSRYPILDAPVRAWRSYVGFDKGVGGTEGERYIRLARAMRAAMREVGPRRLGVTDLAELDALIWAKFQKKRKTLQ